MKSAQTKKIKQLFFTGILIIIGQILFKYLPIKIFGENILFDSSNHVAGTVFILYIIYSFYSFTEKNKKWKIFYFILSVIVIIIVAIQRIIAKEHNLFGVTLGFIIAGLAIAIPRWREIKK